MLFKLPCNDVRALAVAATIFLELPLAEPAPAFAAVPPPPYFSVLEDSNGIFDPPFTTLSRPEKLRRQLLLSVSMPCRWRVVRIKCTVLVCQQVLTLPCKHYQKQSLNYA